MKLKHNVAGQGTATQSSDWRHESYPDPQYNYPGSPFIASYAIDGDFGTYVNSSGGGCAIATDKVLPVWWQVELREVYEINKVAITGRNLRT